MEFETVATSLLSQRWVFAKTMPEHPHWYALRKEWQGKLKFDAVVRYIRTSMTVWPLPSGIIGHGGSIA